PWDAGPGRSASAWSWLPPLSVVVCSWIRPLAFAQRRDGGGNPLEAVARPPRCRARADEAVDQARLLAPPGTAAGGDDPIAIGLAVRGQRVAFRGDDDGGRQAGEVAVVERCKPRVFRGLLAGEPKLAIDREIAQGQHRRFGVFAVGTPAHSAAEAGIDQH